MRVENEITSDVVDRELAYALMVSKLLHEATYIRINKHSIIARAISNVHFLRFKQTIRRLLVTTIRYLGLERAVKKLIKW